MLRFVPPGRGAKFRPALVTARVGEKGSPDVLLLGMIVLGLVTFGVMWAFIDLCERV
jgi:hypothetical protein